MPAVITESVTRFRAIPAGIHQFQDHVPLPGAPSASWGSTQDTDYLAGGAIFSREANGSCASLALGLLRSSGFLFISGKQGTHSGRNGAYNSERQDLPYG